MMFEAYYLVIVAIVFAAGGFVAGVLVGRNNAKDVEKVIANMKAEYNRAAKRAEELKAQAAAQQPNKSGTPIGLTWERLADPEALARAQAELVEMLEAARSAQWRATGRNRHRGRVRAKNRPNLSRTVPCGRFRLTEP